MVALVGIVHIPLSCVVVYDNQSLVCYVKLAISTQVPGMMRLIAVVVLLGGVTTTLAGK